MITIAKTFTFDAAHRLENMPEGHKCRRLHGHTYSATLELHGLPDEHGVLVDYDDIAKAWEPIHAALDHRLLNEIRGLELPTTEVLVCWIFARLLRPDSPIAEHLSKVRVAESSTTWAEISAESFRDALRDQRNGQPVPSWFRSFIVV